MSINSTTLCILLSSLSFFAYVLSYFINPHMKSEFKRFNLEKTGLLIIILQFLGAVGLLVGLEINIILIISSLGLALLMFLGLAVRIKLKDSLWISLPALFYMSLKLITIKRITRQQDLPHWRVPPYNPAPSAYPRCWQSHSYNVPCNPNLLSW